MEFNQFVDEVKGRIKQFLPIEYEDAQVRIEEVKKLNENYLGITVLKENQVIAPTFNLNQLYEMFQSDPQNSMENILRNITQPTLNNTSSTRRNARRVHTTQPTTTFLPNTTGADIAPTANVWKPRTQRMWQRKRRNC